MLGFPIIMSMCDIVNEDLKCYANEFFGGMEEEIGRGGRERERERETETETETERKTERERERETKTVRQRQTDR